MGSVSARDAKRREAKDEDGGALHLVELTPDPAPPLPGGSKKLPGAGVEASLPASLACGEGGGGEWFLADQG
jgi:hypothetical protein